MVSGINFNNIKYTIPFKSTKRDAVISQPAEFQNKNLSGLEALGNYNSTLAMQNPDFDIPILKPVKIPRDINNIVGKRIYSSDGKLVQIIEEDAKMKKVYKPVENGICYSVIDKNVNKEIFFQRHWYNTNEIALESYAPHNGFRYGATYENNELMNYNKFKEFSNGSCISIDYNTREQLYNYEIYDTKTSTNITKLYNSNKQLIDKCVKKYDETSHSKHQTNYIGAEPISEEYTQTNSIKNDVANKILNDKDFKPIPKIEYPTDLNKIHGKKTYYSDGTVESVVTPDNVKYTYDLGENFLIINDKNREIFQYPDDNYYSIEEKLNDKRIKKTIYYPDGSISVSYQNNGNEKGIILSNGKINQYNETIDGEFEKTIIFDENGNAIKEFNNVQDYIAW